MSARIFISALLAVLAGTAATAGNASERARYAKLAKPLSFKVLRQVVENTVGDVVQLVRTLPCRWLESHTVTANSLPYSTECTGNRRIYIRMRFASVANARGPIEPKLGQLPQCHRTTPARCF